MAQQSGDIIVEFIRVGNVVRVSAVCTRTGREVRIVGDPKASKRELETVAIRKLQYVMEKEANLPKGAKKGLFS